MGTRSLDVMIAGEHAGVLSQDESGALSFAYLGGYRGTPIGDLQGVKYEVQFRDAE